MYTVGERIVPRDIEEEIKDSYLSYAMSVIVGRALPDARDGLKPVHRRVLYAMKDLGLEHNKAYKKCARIVGEILGKYHPHGDMAVYDTLVRLAQDFSMRYPLVDGQGNFGCFTGDTKIRLVDGTIKSFEELAQLPPDAQCYVYSVNRDKEIIIGRGRHARCTRRNAALVEVSLDNGTTIRCTPDHRFLLRNGSYKQAQNLTPADSLMAGYFDLAPVREDAPVYNHRVVQVRPLQQREDVYDITVDDHHNFLLDAGVFVHNSIDGDSPAAMRYTEARLEQLAEELLADLDKDTVDFGPNFDDSLQEPKLLPAAAPQLLINGSSGIAVGMATNIPPHNLREIIDALIKLIDEPATELKELMKLVKGPDFPTAGIICGRAGIRDAYTTGRGSLKVRAAASIEEQKGGKQAIVVTEIPYQVNKAALLETIAGLVRDKKIEGISDLRDESDKEGLRMVVELKRDAVAQVVLNQLFKHTQLETTFGIIMLALVHGRPKVCALKELLEIFIEHRREVIRRRTQYDLTKAQERAHILEGYKLAIKHLDAIIKLIKQSQSPAVAKEGLVKQFDFSERQAQAILELQLQRLTALERDKIDEEYLQLIKDIERYQAILASPAKLMGVMRDELLVLKERHGDERRTQIVAEVEEIDIEDLIAEEDVVITISHAGYIKRLPVSGYRKQRRGGVGVTAMETREEDFVEHVFVASTHDVLLFFTTTGKVFWIKVHEIPQASRQAKGKAIVNLLALGPQERISTFVAVQAFDPARYLVMATRQGVVKRTRLDAYANPRKAGIIAITLDQGDELIEVDMAGEEDEMILVTQQGKAIRFPVKQVREVGRSGRGVKGLTLAAKDKVMAMEFVRPKTTLLTVTTLGYGKRSDLEDYRGQNRGGSGVTNIKVMAKNGPVVGAKIVTDQDELILVTQEGMTVRCPIKDIRVTGRIAQGVRLIALRGKDRVTSIARVPAEEETSASPQEGENK